MSAEVSQRVHRPDENGMTEGDHREDMESGSDSGDRSDADPDQQEDHDQDPQTDKDYDKDDSLLSVLGSFIVCLLVGFAFGFCVEKSRAFEPIHIRGQMIFKKTAFMKMMVSAIATGMLGLSLLAMLPFTHNKFQRVCIHFYSSLSDKGVLACTIGGLFTGTGMALCGATPLFTYIQMAAGVPNAVYTIAGCIVGIIVHGLLKRYTDKVTKPYFRSSTNPWIESSYFITALPLVAMFGMLVFAFELLVPWTVEAKVKASQPYLERKAWPPYVSGCLIGLLHLPMVLGAERGLGDIGALVTLLSHLFVGPVRKLSPYLGRYRFNRQSWTQVLFVAGMIAGTYYSCSLSGTEGLGRGVPPAVAFTGGLIMMYGAQMAGGAAVFHGQTGMGLLSILSIITVTFTACSSISTAYIMKAMGVINPGVKAS